MLKRCINCGTDFEREIPADLPPVFRRILESVRWCETCTEQAQAQEALERQETDDRSAVDRVQSRQASCGMPTELRGISWGDLHDVPPQALAQAKAWTAGLRRGLVLAGNVGVGKTWLAAAAAWARLEQGPVCWFSAPVLFARLGLPYGDERQAAAEDALVDRTALVLDDIDKARPTDYAAEKLFLAIDTRVTEGLPLLVTTNLGLPELADRFPNGEAIVSRLAGYCETFLLEGVDRRLERFAA